MSTRANDFTTTVRTEGALLPADLLRRVQAGDRTLPALTPEAYHLPGGMRLNEAASRAWNALLGAWAAFRDARAKLPEGDLGTTVTRERWLLPLFQELNYGRLQTRNAVEAGGKSFAVSHGYLQVPIHLVGCNVDLDKRTAGVAGAATASPHSLVQELLNRSDEHLWGIVSNGLRLRVLRDSRSLTRSAYLEFDLEGMFEGEQYADFVLLFLLLHQSRLEAQKPEDCVLEQWAREAAETGARALDRLRDGVQTAIEALGKGFLRGDNGELKRRLREGDLSPQDYYRQLLRLVYRLLFLFVAEDRDLLHPKDADHVARARYRHYSTQSLRELAGQSKGGRHGDLYEALKVVMRALSEGGEPRLGLPELGGLLFSERSLVDLMQATLPNAYLLQAVRALAYTEVQGARRPVDYRNLGSEELGSVYESLLELHPEVDATAHEFELKTAAGHERKTTGSYYTPRSLINLLLDSALDPVIDDAMRGKTSKEDAEKALLDLKVVDPAAGSGHFLIAAAQRLAKRLAAVRTGDDEPAPDAVRTALRDVIGRCIYGVDVNEMAAELCKVALWMEAMEPGKPLAFLERQIRTGNSLLGGPVRVALLDLVSRGIPDEAFAAQEDDVPQVVSSLRKANQQERKGQARLFGRQDSEDAARDLARRLGELRESGADSPSEVKRLEEEFQRVWKSPAARLASFVCDAYVSAFLAPKVLGGPRPITSADLRGLWAGESLEEDRLESIGAVRLEHKPFHWGLEFADLLESSGGFDAVIGNPPYGALLSGRSRVLGAFLYPTASMAKNVAADFIEMASSIAAPRGRVGFIVPKSITYSATWKPIRNWLKDRLLHAIDVGKAWRDVLLEQTIIVYRPSVRSASDSVSYGRVETRSISWRYEEAHTLHRLEAIPTGLTAIDLEILRAIRSPETRLGEQCHTARGTGLQRYLLDLGDTAVVGGRSITPFGRPEPLGYVIADQTPRIRITRPPQAVFQNIVSHVTQPRDHIKLIGTVVDNELAVLDTVNVLYLRDSTLTPYAICAYLMSDCVNWYVHVCLFNRAVRTMHFDNYILEQIPGIGLQVAQELDEVGRILACHPDDSAAWERLNAIVNDYWRVPSSLAGEIRRSV